MLDFDNIRLVFIVPENVMLKSVKFQIISRKILVILGKIFDNITHDFDRTMFGFDNITKVLRVLENIC